MGLLTFSINVTLDGCVDHREGIADEESHAFFTRLMDEAGAMLWGRVTYEMMETYWPAVARGDEEAPPAVREWAVKLEAKPKYVVSSTRKNFPWTNSHPIAGDLHTSVQKLKDAIPAGVLPAARSPCITGARTAKESSAAVPQGISRSGQTSTTPWATAQGVFETSLIASSRSFASMTANPAIGRSLRK